MPRLSASLSKEQYAWVESESESTGDSMAEVIRTLIDKERGVLSESPTESKSDVDLDSLVNQIESLEQRVTELESPQTDTEATESDLLAYVRNHGPCKAKELKQHCYPEDSEYARSTWWTKIAKDQLKESNAQYRNNIGWSFEESTPE